MKHFLYGLCLIAVLCTSCKSQNKTDSPQNENLTKTYALLSDQKPQTITRNIKQDKNGNIWIAAFDGIFKYDGTTFTNITNVVSSASFFAVLEDRKGNFWFSSVGEGVYYYDGKSFQNFTTKEGLVNDRVIEIFEDKTSNVWFGSEGGISRWDGTSFLNYTTQEGLSNNDVNTIIEDKNGKFWIGTRGEACFYDGKTFSVFSHNDKPFTNVRKIMEDSKGNIWLGGNDGLWRYDGNSFVNFTQNFVGYIYEDKTGNIWTSSKTAEGWALSRYDAETLSAKEPKPIEIVSKEKMIFGILEAFDGSIWYGTLDGVSRYDGNTITDF